MLKKVGAVVGALLGIIALFTALYKLDCYNIAVHGDTLYATDSALAAEVQKDRVSLKQMKVQLNLQQQLRRAESKLERFSSEYQANLLWLNEIRKQYPNKDDMPSETFTQYRKVKKKNEKVLKKIEKWEKKRDELEEKELEMMQTTGGEL